MDMSISYPVDIFVWTILWHAFTSDKDNDFVHLHPVRVNTTLTLIGGEGLGPIESSHFYIWIGLIFGGTRFLCTIESGGIVKMDALKSVYWTSSVLSSDS